MSCFHVILPRRRSLQYHYAASECKPIKCPKEDASKSKETPPPQQGAPGYFDCDPNCVEAPFFDFKKAEMLVAGRDYGSDYI